MAGDRIFPDPDPVCKAPTPGSRPHGISTAPGGPDLKLHYFPVAPNPTKVRVYLAEKGIEIEQVRVNLPGGEARSRAFLALNPMGKLPVLELDDGTPSSSISRSCTPIRP